MDRRIFGLETEYGVTCAADEGRGLSADEVARVKISTSTPRRANCSALCST